jgi:hypothetical protein
LENYKKQTQNGFMTCFLYPKYTRKEDVEYINLGLFYVMLRDVCGGFRVEATKVVMPILILITIPSKFRSSSLAFAFKEKNHFHIFQPLLSIFLK